LPIERRDFRASVDDTWAATLKTIETSGGIISFKDKKTYRIVCTLYHEGARRQFELSVLLKDMYPQYGVDVTAVLLSVRASRVGDYSAVVNSFFNKLEKNLTPR
jgi:hypothetical protein